MNSFRDHAPILMCDSHERYLDGIVTYVREAHENQDTWLQYWTWYTADRDHLGDWQLVQLRMVNNQPDLAVYAAHRAGECRPWAETPQVEGRPVVYASWGKHAAYFQNGWHRRGWSIERANGRIRVDPPLIEGAAALKALTVWGQPSEIPVPSRQRSWKKPTTWAAGLKGYYPHVPPEGSAMIPAAVHSLTNPEPT